MATYRWKLAKLALSLGLGMVCLPADCAQAAPKNWLRHNLATGQALNLQLIGGADVEVSVRNVSSELISIVVVDNTKQVAAQRPLTVRGRDGELTTTYGTNGIMYVPLTVTKNIPKEEGIELEDPFSKAYLIYTDPAGVEVYYGSGLIGVKPNTYVLYSHRAELAPKSERPPIVPPPSENVEPQEIRPLPKPVKNPRIDALLRDYDPNAPVRFSRFGNELFVFGKMVVPDIATAAVQAGKSESVFIEAIAAEENRKRFKGLQEGLYQPLIDDPRLRALPPEEIRSTYRIITGRSLDDDLQAEAAKK